MTEEEKKALDELMKANAELVQAAADFRDGKLDDTVVDRIGTVVLEKLQAANPHLASRSGFTPGDGGDDPKTLTGLLSKTGPARIQALVETPVKRAAAITRISESDLLELHQAADQMSVLATICQHHGIDPTATRFYGEHYRPLVQAMDSATTAEGTEYVPTELSASLIERISLQLRVAALFPSIPMPTATYEIPGMPVSRTRLGKHAEQSADTGQTKFTAVTPGTRKVTLTAKKFAGRALISRDFEEDAIVAMLPWLIDELGDYIAADLEDCIINGDTTATHQDSDVTASDDPRKNFAGLRKLTASGFKTSVGAAPTVANTVRANRLKMGKYGVNPAELAHIVSIWVYLQLLSDTNVLTMDKYGPNATIVQGELGKVDGSPIIVSEYVRADLNASGVVDGVTTTKTELITAHRRGFLRGTRRGVTTEVLRELYAESDQDAVIISRRDAFAARYPNTEGVSAVAYNVS